MELGTATLKTRNAEKKTPSDSFLRKKKNASGGVEAKFLSCKECGVEFCTGDGCKVFDYDSFKRVTVSVAQPVGEPTQERAVQDKKLPKKKIPNKGPKTKSRSSNATVVADASKKGAEREGAKNRYDKNNVISVKTNKKTVVPTPTNRSKRIDVKSNEMPSFNKNVDTKKCI